MNGQERERVMASTTSQAVLRRRSWLIFCGIAIVGLGIGFSVAVFVGDFRTGWQGMPIYLALAIILGRIANCKVILRDDALLVVNPLRTHIVPKALIRGALVGDDGSLEVELGEDRNISVFAFGGSLVDHFKGSSGEAARKISRWLDAPRATGEAQTALQVRWTRCKYADISLVLCAVISGVGAIWMALSGSS
ncbi:hypothetical protein [Streptomyces tailanensis]|uniref:hypothetical protein n=1 Tax=Streptomyces tailanensis TaxID=2569858 RepID=UPI00122DCA25|nr:hypothetical protein [Streptomyces tailanensis]